MPRRWGLRFFQRLAHRRPRGGRRPGDRPGGIAWHVCGYEPLECRLPLALDVQVRFEFADPQGAVLNALHVGDNFTLNVYVKDIRTVPAGIFQAYLDLNYPAALTTVTGAITHGAAYNTVPVGDISTAGLVDEAGGIDSDQLAPSPAGIELLLVSVPMHANAEGSVTVTADLAENPARKIVLFDRVSGTLLEEIQFVGGTIGITPDSGAPTLTTINTLAGAIEDTAFPITYATLAAAADEADPEGQSISFRVESVTSGVLTKNGVPVVGGTTLLSAGESLVWTAASQANGTLGAFTVRAFDGSLASNTAVPVNVSVAAVNDAPSFTKGPDQWLDTAGPHTINGWATAISRGPADESAQTLTFQVATDNNGLFSVLPAIAANGTLSYTLVASAKGQAQVTVTLKDNGGTANGGQDTSAPQAFLLLVNQDSLWQNPRDPLDVDANLTVEPLDLLWVINDLIANGLHGFSANPSPPNVPPPFLDVDGNHFVYPLDALVLVNHFIAVGTAASHSIAPPGAVGSSAAVPQLLAAGSLPAGAAEPIASQPRLADAVFGALACGVTAGSTNEVGRSSVGSCLAPSGAAATRASAHANGEHASKTLARLDASGEQCVDLALCELARDGSDDAAICVDEW